MTFRVACIFLLLQVVCGDTWVERDGEICGDRIWNALCVRLKNQGYCGYPEMKTNCALTCGYCEADRRSNNRLVEEAEQQEEEEQEQGQDQLQEQGQGEGQEQEEGQEQGQDQLQGQGQGEGQEQEEGQEQGQQQEQEQGQNKEEGTKGNTDPSSQINAPTCGRSTVASSRVIAGTDASLGEWPWQVWLDIEGSGFSCGGSLIAPIWVLTAAHCILETDPKKYRVIIGDVKHNKNESSEQTFEVDKIIVHENYNKPVGINNDVTLLKLSRPARINAFVRTVCLPSAHEMVPLKTKCYITGWGMTSHPGESSPVLQQAPMPVAPSTLCQAGVLNETHVITAGMLCAGDKGKTKISGCFGDSGGPFVCRNAKGQWVQQGVVSWGGPSCNSANHFTVFARVSMYRDWIEKNIQENQK